MSERIFSLQRVTNLLIIATLATYVLIVGKMLLVPLAFGLLFAFLLEPLSEFFERFLPFRALAILLSFITALLPVLALMVLFSFHLVNLFGNLGQIFDRIKLGLSDALTWLAGQLGIGEVEVRNWLLDNFSTALDSPVAILGRGITSSTNLLVCITLCAVSTFFFMLYRTSLKNFLLGQVPGSIRPQTISALQDIQRITRQYLYGLLIVILILGLMISGGLWVIGLDFPWFWGFLAACLGIIPYLGTTLGGTLPFLYSLATADSIWQPLFVVILYVTIQQIEGNLITPKVVGHSVRINPFAAILSLFVGGAVWGISGLILAIPFVAILRVTFHHIDAFKPLGLLLGDHLYRNRDKFLEEYDEDRYRLTDLFFRKRQEGPKD